MVLTLIFRARVQAMHPIRRHHCLHHCPFNHRFIGCIDIDTQGHVLLKLSLPETFGGMDNAVPPSIQVQARPQSQQSFSRPQSAGVIAIGDAFFYAYDGRSMV